MPTSNVADTSPAQGGGSVYIQPPLEHVRPALRLIKGELKCASLMKLPALEVFVRLEATNEVACIETLDRITRKFLALNPSTTLKSIQFSTGNDNRLLITIHKEPVVIH